MKSNDFKRLSAGDILRHKVTGDVYMVSVNYGDRVTLVRTIDTTNPDIWEWVVESRPYDPETGELFEPRRRIKGPLGDTEAFPGSDYD